MTLEQAKELADLCAKIKDLREATEKVPLGTVMGDVYSVALGLLVERKESLVVEIYTK